MVSVCMATFNGSKYLQMQLNSILNQLQPDDELLISDDGSTDGTIEILEKLNLPNVQVFKNNFQNIQANFEFLLNKTTKAIICLCDQDDVWLPNKRKVIVDTLKDKSKLGLLMNAELMDAQSRKLNQTTFMRWGTRLGFWANWWRNTYMGSSMAFTADCKSFILPFPNKIAMHDWWIGLLIEKLGTLYVNTEPVMHYRIHGANNSLQGSNLQQKINWRLDMLKAVLARVKGVKS